jgi:hypothetical protein
MTDKPTSKVGRLALRVEGADWVAYYAMPDTMEGALRLASIKMALVQNPVRKDGFMMLMQDVIADILQDVTGERAEWPDPPEIAPDHERSGRG